jgi:hypothetical protein
LFLQNITTREFYDFASTWKTSYLKSPLRVCSNMMGILASTCCDAIGKNPTLHIFTIFGWCLQSIQTLCSYYLQFINFVFNKYFELTSFRLNLILTMKLEKLFMIWIFSVWCNRSGHVRLGSKNLYALILKPLELQTQPNLI